MKSSLARQIFIYFLIVIVISLASVSLFSYLQSSRALDRQMEKYIAQMINNASYQTDLYLETYKDVSNSILSNFDVKHFLDMAPDDSYAHFYYSSQIKSYVLEPVSIQYPQINRIYLIGNNGRAVMNGTPFDTSHQLKWLWENTPETGEIAIFTEKMYPGQSNVITLARRIRGYSSYEPSGVLAIELKVQELTRIWRYMDLGEEGYFFIMDAEGRFVYHPEEKRIGEIADESFRNHMDSGEGSFIHKAEGRNRLYVTRASDESGWKLTLSMPVEELRAPIDTIRTTTIIVGLVTLAFALWLAYRFGESIVTPIRKLKEGMRETEKGNWRRIEGTERTDEIGGLMRSYNLMVTRLSQMIERVYEAELVNQKAALALQETELEKQKAEYQSLQLQINPHFLYNTLATVDGYAIVQKSVEISEIVEAMAFMLRYSLQTNLEEITIANELNHIRNYLMILKHRIGRDFEIDVAVAPDLLLEKCVRLTLQPLVENAFQHAFPDGIDENSVIRIDAKAEGGYFYLIVEDNGAGLTADQLHDLRQRLSQNRLAESSGDTLYHSGGIGLMNVNRRIQLVFGEQYGLLVDSEEGRGTRFTMKMPEQIHRRRTLT
ncbi:cache domain-containing sensor histidine kinase [Paenibacillus gansuensis]|uniref:histidine kinase n=1 Tax=Paenibacillus gansuensis TaxID=306542 RepID=A0ABW5PCT9_9BACL